MYRLGKRSGKSLSAEAYLELCQTYRMENFAKMINSF